MGKIERRAARRARNRHGSQGLRVHRLRNISEALAAAQSSLRARSSGGGERSRSSTGRSPEVRWVRPSTAASTIGFGGHDAA